MATPLPPPPVQKKSGPGCFGCGCIIVVVLAFLIAGLVAGGCYMLYAGIYAVTSPTASVTQTYDGGDDLNSAADQKLTTFYQALNQHQPASLQLSADEMNTLLTRDETFARLKIRLFITLHDDQARVQFSYPMNLFPMGLKLYKDRYLNGETSLSVQSNPDEQTIRVILHSLQMGGQTVPEEQLPMIQNLINPSLNTQLQKQPTLREIVTRAKTIEIKDGEFVIETN